MERLIKANLFHIITLAATICGAGYLSVYRLDALEAKTTELQEQINRDREVIGNMQLDIAVVCSILVQEQGGNPLTTCHTSGAHR